MRTAGEGRHVGLGNIRVGPVEEHRWAELDPKHQTVKIVREHIDNSIGDIVYHAEFVLSAADVNAIVGLFDDKKDQGWTVGTGAHGARPKTEGEMGR